jgi:hypothetical protein
MVREIACAKSPAFLRDSTRNLMFHCSSGKEAHRYLTLFPGVENLVVRILQDGVFNNDDAPLPALEIPRLKHLYCVLDELVLCIPFSSFSHPLFTNITHMELFRDFRFPDGTIEWTGLKALACLTHLAFHSTDMIPICVHILATFNSLRTLIIHRSLPTDFQSELEILAADPRFVMMAPVLRSRKDWEMGILTGQDCWVRADEFIAKRRSGEIDSEF